MTDEELRKELQNTVQESGMTDIEIARLIMISRPTVTRWRDGTNSAHPIMIPSIIKKIKKGK